MSTRFSKDHEYVHLDGTTGTIGISDFAQSQLGDIVFVELPTIGAEVKQGDEVAVVESVKAASEIYAPMSGKVTAVNTTLAGDPGLINADAEATGWIFKLALSDVGEAEGLMDADAYSALEK